jgi:peptide/nickel transport system substrate-binding protein
VPSLPGTTAPERPATAAWRLALGLVHETLLGIGPEGDLRPALARSWAPSAGGAEWTLSLDPRARFHDDSPVTGADAVRSIRRFLAARTPAALRLGQELASDGVLAPGEGRVLLRFREPRQAPLFPLASLAAAITNASGSGAGPFVPTLAIPGGRLAVTAFAGHVGGRPFLDGLALVAIPDAERRRAELAAGRVDLALGEPGAQALASTLVLVLDPSQPPFGKKAARSAVAAAIDRATLVEQYLPNSQPWTLLLPPTLAGRSAPSPLPRGKLGSAVAGEISLAVASDVPATVSQRVVAHLDALGLRVRATPLEPEAVRASRAAARLLLFTPEVAEPSLAIAELAALAPRGANVALPLAAVPVSIGARVGVQGVRTERSGRVALEDTWLEP